MIALIFAVAANGVIGRDNDLPWHLPADLQHFKTLTTGHTIVMGRRTYDSIGRALPNRRSIVLTRDAGFQAPGVETANGWDDLATMTTEDEQVFVIGGADIFRLALPHADVVYRTRILADVPGDVTLPDLDEGQWKLEKSEMHDADERHAYPFTFERLTRVTP